MNKSITSFNLNYLFNETVYNNICFTNIHLSFGIYLSYKSITLDKKTISINDFAIEIEENIKIGIILRIFKIKSNDKILLKILPSTIKKEQFSNYFQIDKKSTNPEFVEFKKVTTFFKIVNKHNIDYLLTKIKNYNK